VVVRCSVPVGRRLSMKFADRAAINEEIFREVNERIDEGAKQHGIESPTPFHCECGRASCLDKLELPPGMYERVVAERYHFVVIPGHEDGRIERVAERHPEFLVVEKIGEARLQIDRDHPQRRHRRPG
jgi:hypothetical protein